MTGYLNVLLVAAIFFPPFFLGLRMGFSTFIGWKIRKEEIILALVLILAIYLRVDIGNMVGLIIAGFSIGCAFYYVKTYLERKLGVSATRYVIIFSMSTAIYLAIVRNNFEVSNITTLLISSLFIWMIPEIKNKFREVKS